MEETLGTPKTDTGSVSRQVLVQKGCGRVCAHPAENLPERCMPPIPALSSIQSCALQSGPLNRCYLAPRKSEQKEGAKSQDEGSARVDPLRGKVSFALVDAGRI